MSVLSVEVKGADEFAGQMQAMPSEVDKAMSRALLRAGQTVSKFWKLHLSGPAGPARLGIGTGALRRSITVGKVEGDQLRVGTSLPYAAIHEFGFSGAVNVSAHLRKTRSGLAVPVRAHVRQMNMPMRPHRAPAIRDSRRPVDLIFAGEIDKAAIISKQTGNRLKFQQRAQLADIRRAGGTGRRTR
jgi:phage gpG-like protein